MIPRMQTLIVPTSSDVFLHWSDMGQAGQMQWGHVDAWLKRYGEDTHYSREGVFILNFYL